MKQIGDRVLAILGASNGVVKVIGEGIYEGNFVPREAVGQMAEALVELEVENPRIKLDNGKIVYGCECWWGPVENMRKQCEGMKLVDVDIDEVRAEWRAGT